VSGERTNRSNAGDPCSASSSDVTAILARINDGDSSAHAALLSAIYDELHRLAADQMGRERPDHTLQPTALVHEAYLRLVGEQSAHWENRAHFFGAAAEAMRRVLVDHARKRLAAKRGGGRARLVLEDEPEGAAAPSAEEIIAVHEALQKLAEFDAQKSEIVKLRFFAGLTAEETARVLDLSLRTVKRHWRFAKAWLYREIMGE